MSARLVQLGLVSLISSAIAIPIHPTGGFFPSADASFSGPKGTGGFAHGTGHPHGTGYPHHGHGTGSIKPSKTRSAMEALATAATPTSAASDFTNVAVAAVDQDETSTDCSTATYYSTTTDIETVYVTPSSVAAAAVDSTIFASSIVPSSAPVAVPSSSSSYSAAASAAASSISQAANHFSFSRPAAVAPTSSTAAAPAASSSAPVVQPPVQAAPATTTAASTPVASSGSSAGGKRGIAYATASQATPLIGKTQWAYNWASSPNGLASGVEYLPMLWSDASAKTSSWVSDATKAIANGATAILGFNEPDLGAQANMSPQQAATSYQQYITNNFAGKAKLISPAVTNGGGSMGLTWLSTFMGLCSGCKIDAVAIHWYDVSTNIAYFKSHIEQAHTDSGLPVYVTEFGTTDGNDQAFLEAVLPWLDSQDYIERYAYFMAEDGKLLSGSGLSAAGDTYCA